jgi:putative ABC transport system permease protein
MKMILRNFISTLNRFKTACLLNVLGLSIAFAAFCIIGLITLVTVTFQTRRTANENSDNSFS